MSFSRGSMSLLVCALFLVSILPFSSGLTIKKDVDSLITFPVIYDGSNAPVGTTCNFSVIYPNQSLMMENQEATYTGTGVASFILIDNSINGDYKVPLICSFPSGDSDSGNADFTINPTGQDITKANMSIYLGLMIILLVLLIGIIFTLFKTENFGWKMGLTSFAYIISNGFFLVCWKVAEMFLVSMPFLEVIFRILYTISTIGYFPMFLFILGYSLLHMTDEKNIKTLMNRGFTEDQARYRSRRN